MGYSLHTVSMSKKPCILEQERSFSSLGELRVVILTNFHVMFCLVTGRLAYSVRELKGLRVLVGLKGVSFYSLVSLD